MATTVLKYNMSTIGYISHFKKITGVDARDCFEENGTIVFVTGPKKAGLAVGRQGENVRRLNRDLKKEIKIVEASEGAEDLVASFLYPLQAQNIYVADKDGRKLLNIKFGSPRERRFLLSDNLQKLKLLKIIVKRYFSDIADVFVLQ